MGLQGYLLELGIEAKLLIGGVVGTIAGISGKTGNWLTKSGTIFTGIGGAVYLTPLASELLGITNEQSRLGVAVLIGYIGISGMQKLLIKKFE